MHRCCTRLSGPKTGKINAQIEENYSGRYLVRVYGHQAEAEREFAEQNKKLLDVSFGAQFLSSLIMPVMNFVGNITYVLLAVVGALKVASGNMSLGDVQAFIVYSRQFSQPLTQIASMSTSLQSGAASAERVFELLDEPEQSPDIDVPLMPEPAGRHRNVGHIEFENVSFRYEPDKPLIENVYLTARPGQMVAIVGPTGAGKTTLVNLLMRFYEVDSGRITLDDVDISQMRRSDLRKHVGMVLQDTWLFGGTIRDNIAYGRLDASEYEIHEAARAAFVDPSSTRSRTGTTPCWTRRHRTSAPARSSTHHDCPSIPVGAVAADSRRGDQLGRHTYGTACAASNVRVARRAHQLHHRAPALHHP